MNTDAPAKTAAAITPRDADAKSDRSDSFRARAMATCCKLIGIRSRLDEIGDRVKVLKTLKVRKP